MRTIRTKVYQFNELNDEAKQVAIENYRNNHYDVELDGFIEGAKERIEEAGFKGNSSLSYSLGYSQGDGLSFSCDYFDKLNEVFIEILGEGKQKSIDCIINDLAFSLEGNNGRYYFASKSDLNLTLENYNKDYENIESVVSKIRENLENLYIKLCQDLEKQGYSEIEYQNSDEYITETLIANEYEFTKEGNIF